MGQPKPPTTEITPEKPLIVQTYTPRSVQYGLSEFAKATAENAAMAQARRNRALDSLVGRPETPTLDAEGKVVPTNMANIPFDSSIFFDPDKNTFLAEEIEEAAERKKNRQERRRERMGEDDMNNIFGMSRASYLNALQKSANQGRST